MGGFFYVERYLARIPQIQILLAPDFLIDCMEGLDFFIKILIFPAKIPVESRKFIGIDIGGEAL